MTGAVMMDEGRKASRSWPEYVDPQMAMRLVDCHMIGSFERQPLTMTQAFQAQRLARWMAYARSHSAWWREHLPNGNTGHRLMDLPLMGRPEFRDSVQSGPLTVPDGHGAVKENATSGSSGLPAKFFQSALALRIIRSHYHFDHTRQGRDVNRRLVTIDTRVPVHEGEHITDAALTRGSEPSLRRRLPQFTIEAHARWLAKVKPTYLSTLPTLLAGILDEFERVSVEPPHIEQVATFAETVEPTLRARAKAILNASIRDRYTCEEVGPLAFQCAASENYYHIAGSNAIVEILDEAGHQCRPGDLGRVFVSSLHNYASPVLRYELNDLAAWQPRCVCGFQGRVLEKMLGKKRFLIRLTSGERKVVRLVASNWLDIAPVREHRLVQTSEQTLRAELVLERPLTASERQAALTMLHSEIDPDLTYEIVEVEKICWGPTYKRQDVVSLI